MRERMNTPETRRNNEVMVGLEQQNYLEEDLWSDEYSALEERTYFRAENDGTGQEHRKRRDTVNRTG